MKRSRTKHDTPRAAILVFVASGTFAGLGSFASAQENTPKPTPTPALCARPNLPASVLRAVAPEAPALAQQQGIQGTVQVIVSLDEYSHVIGARILSSPSVILNAPALVAARQSTFQTEIRACRPIAGDYIFTVEFESKVTFSISASGERTVSVTGEGTVKRAPDRAYVEANIVTQGNVATDAVAQNEAAFTALNAKLAAAGIGARIVRDAEPRRSAAGYAWERYVEIAVDDLANLGRAEVAVSSVRYVEMFAVRFELRDSAPAQREALSLAVRDAEKSAGYAVTGQHLRLGVVRQVIVHGNDRARSPIAVVPVRIVPVVGGFTEPVIRVPDLEVHASATVTYAIKS